MKTYEKPKLMVLSISASDALCSCTARTRFENDINVALKSISTDINGDGIIQKSETGNYFANNEADCTAKFSLDGYCKFTTENGMMLFTS